MTTFASSFIAGSIRYTVACLAAITMAYSPQVLAGDAPEMAFSQDKMATLQAQRNSSPMLFTRNDGQWDGNVLYGSITPDAGLSFLPGGVSFGIQRRHEDLYDILVWKMSFLFANPGAVIEHGPQRGDSKNFLLWKGKNFPNVPQYDELTYRNVFNGVDVRFSTVAGDSRSLKYDFILAPGSSADDIRMRYDGVRSVRLNEKGHLVVEHEWGAFSESIPHSWEVVDGVKREVEVAYCLLGDNTYGFEVRGDRDPCAGLVIDPVILQWSSFIGGNPNIPFGEGGQIYDVAADAQCNFYATGIFNGTLPSTPGAYQASGNGAFVIKLDPTGATELYGTFLGVGAGWGIDVNNAGQAFITGDNGYVIKLNAGGTAALYVFNIGNGSAPCGCFDGSCGAGCSGCSNNVCNSCPCTGGNSGTGGRGIVVNAADEAIVTGLTGGTGFTPTAGAAQAAKGGGVDAFVVKVNAAGSALVYATYLGGNGTDAGFRVKIDAAGNPYIAGSTNSANFPVSGGAFQAANAGGMDAFAAKLNANATAVVWATYLGGSGTEQGYGIAVNLNNDAYVTGPTTSANFPKQNPLYAAMAGGGKDAFVTKINNTGTGLIYSTYLGGNDVDEGFDVEVNCKDEAFVTGYAGYASGQKPQNANFPVVSGCGLNETFSGNVSASPPPGVIFVTKFNSTGTALLYSGIKVADRYRTALDLCMVNCCVIGVVDGGTRTHIYPAYITTPGAWRANDPRPNKQLIPIAFRLTPQMSIDFSSTVDPGCTSIGNFTANITPPCWGQDSALVVWDFGDGSPNDTGLAVSHQYTVSGTYQVTMRSTCPPDTIVKPITITVQPCGPTVTVTGDTICPGACGTVTATPDGGTPPYTYTWSPNVGTDAGPHPVCPTVNTTYTVTVTDSDGKTSTGSGTVIIRTPPPLTLTPSPVSCNGACDGSVTATPSGSAPFTYTWSNTATTQAISGLCPGTYGVTVTDKNGCASTSSAPITEPTPLTLTISPDQTICPDDTPTLNLSVTASGATPGYTYLWAPVGQTTATITVSPTATTTYYVTVTDANGCALTDSVTITTVCAPLIALPPSVICLGDTATLVPQVSGGQPPYTYTWTNGLSGPGPHAVNPTATTAYCLTVTDQNGKTADTCATVTVNNPPAVTTTRTDATCGQCDGSVNVSATGSSPFTYLWNDGCTSASCVSKCTGAYSVTVTDANGCVSTGNVNVNNTGAPQIDADSTDVACFGQCTGTVAIIMTVPGTPPYTYLWSSGGSGTSESGLCAGPYTVTVTDGVGCVAIATTAVNQPPQLTQSTAKVDAICNGGSDGSIDLSVAGGVSPYGYLWAPGGATTQDITGLTAGTYSFTVTDFNGCTSTGSVTITEPAPLVLTPSATQATCGNADGSVNVTVTGGTGGYTYLWAPGGAITPNVTGLSFGTYTVTVTDANGCSDTASATVTGNGIPSVVIAGKTDIICFGQCTGDATASGSSGTPPYTYLWNDAAGQTSATATALCAGSYEVCLTDQISCKVCATVTITEPPQVTLNVSSADEVCGNGQGSVSATAGGGTPPLTLLWSTGHTDAGVTGLNQGTYGVTVTDASGCTSTGSASVMNQQILPTADFYTSPTEVTILNPFFSFFDKSSGAVSWQWDFGDGGTSVDRNPTHIYADTGCYDVTLMVENQYGCRDTIPQVVCVRDITSLYIPNAFTPNGDGSNDWFTVKEHNYCDFEMYIFDRWGNLIYETTSIKGWDGTANGGAEIVQEDVYVWLVRATDCYGDKWNRIGHVSVIR